MDEKLRTLHVLHINLREQESWGECGEEYYTSDKPFRLLELHASHPRHTYVTSTLPYTRTY
eukprot:m.264011 g.264011  ORF g.264011 m.264011 type:complete len:61 (+) comp15609_c1_seq1:2624-2806(+)